MSFDIGGLRRSDRVIGISAIAFFVFLFFFKWFGVSSSASIGGASYSDSANGWHTFTNSRWIWIITIVVALAAVAINAGALNFKSPVFAADTPAPPTPPVAPQGPEPPEATPA